MRILVTGGAGFIGSHVTDALLARGHHVTVLDNLITGHLDDIPKNATFVAGDVRNRGDIDMVAAEGLDAVIHIAGQASIRKSFDNPAEDLSVNTVGTINVLQSMLTFEVPRLLFASSMTIYGTPEVVPTPETAPPDPIAYYGITKYAAERYVHLTAARDDIDLNVTSLRMFNVYGPRQSLTNPYQGVLAIFLGRVLRGEPIAIHSDGEQSRDFVYVDDVARAWADALEDERTYGEVINIGTGQPTSVNELCDRVLENFGHTRESYGVDYHPAQPGDIRASAADITRAREVFGWAPRVSFADGMRETVAWARAKAEG